MKKYLLVTISIVLAVFVGCSSDTEPPDISITSPSYGDTVDVHTITITADASDNKEVEVVEFYVDNSLLDEDSTSPYENDWPIASYGNLSAHSIYAKAYDLSDNSNQSDVVLVTVKNRGMVNGANTDTVVIIDSTWATSDILMSAGPDQAVVDSVTIIVTIFHQRVSDLDVYLRSPNDTEQQIWDNNFSMPTDSFTTAVYAGEDVNGTWLLRVFDEVRDSLGYIDNWSIDIEWKY